MLHYIDDEEDVFWCLHKIMLEFNWRSFYTEGMERAAAAQERVTEIFESKFGDICQIIDPVELFAVCQSITLNLIMSVFTVKIPLEIAKRVFEFFLYRQNGEQCLFELLESILMRMRPKILRMDEAEICSYLTDHRFVEDCFNEARGTPDWISIFSYRSV